MLVYILFNSILEMPLHIVVHPFVQVGQPTVKVPYHIVNAPWVTRTLCNKKGHLSVSNEGNVKIILIPFSSVNLNRKAGAVLWQSGKTCIEKTLLRNSMSRRIWIAFRTLSKHARRALYSRKSAKNCFEKIILRNHNSRRIWVAVPSPN